MLCIRCTYPSGRWIWWLRVFITGPTHRYYQAYWHITISRYSIRKIDIQAQPVHFIRSNAASCLRSRNLSDERNYVRYSVLFYQINLRNTSSPYTNDWFGGCYMTTLFFMPQLFHFILNMFTIFNTSWKRALKVFLYIIPDYVCDLTKIIVAKDRNEIVSC